MYEVKFIISPIDCYKHYKSALFILSQSGRKKAIIPNDITILSAISDYPKGLRRRTIMGVIGYRMHDESFIKSLNRLIGLDCITRIQQGRSVFYSITVKGRNLLSKLQAIVIALHQAYQQQKAQQ